MSGLIFTVEETTFHCHAEPGGGEVMEIRYRVGADRTFSEWRRIDGSEASRRWWREWSPDPYPASAERAVDIANYHGFTHTKRIAVRYIPGGAWVSVCERGREALTCEEIER